MQKVPCTALNMILDAHVSGCVTDNTGAIQPVQQRRFDGQHLTMHVALIDVQLK